MKWYTYVLIIALVICATTARAETTTIRMFVNDVENPRPVVLMTEQLETVKVKIKNNSTGTEEEISTEEEPDCE
jgi:hypothetical protein